MTKTFRHLVAQGLDKLALACAASAALGMVSIVGIIVVSVLMRKFANSPIHITEEVVGLLLSVSLFLGLPMVTLKSKHVRVSIVVSMLKGKWLVGARIAAHIVGISLLVWLLIEASPWLEFAFQRNLKTETTRILLYPWMALMPFSLFLTCCILIARLLGLIEQNAEENSAQSNSDGAPT